MKKTSMGTRTEINVTDSDLAISVKNLHKSFNLPTEQSFGLKQALFNRLRGIKGYKEQKVLKGIDFEIMPDDDYKINECQYGCKTWTRMLLHARIDESTRRN